MLNRVVHFSVLGFVVFTLLTGCGAVTQSKNRDLSLNLEIPQGEDPALFWFGVTQKTLRVGDGKGDPEIVTWQEGQSQAVDVREGDTVEFLGADDKGRVLVAGEATASGEKTLSIPVRRVL